MTDHNHTPSGPDSCFGCKMAYMRVHGLGFKTPPMRDGVSWFDTTIREQQNFMHAEAAANGNAVHVADSTYDKAPPRLI